MSETILIVDDDINLLSAMRRQLRGRFTVTTAQGGEEALDILRSTKDQPGVILCDMRMGGMNGVETLRQAKDLAPDSVRMMLTGNADMQTAIDAINSGHIFRFLSKPCPPEVLEEGLEAALGQYRLITAERELLEKTLSGSIKVMMDMLVMSYPQGYSRASRIRSWVRKLNTNGNMPHRWQLDLAAILSPLGMLSIPQEVLSKVHIKLPLTETEQAMVERAPEMARNVIANIPRLQGVAQIVFFQNKGYDGSGFPAQGPTGGDIPIDARILKILNDLSSISTGRSPSAADFNELERNIQLYDPVLLRKVRLCLEAIEPSERLLTRQLAVGTLLPGMDLAEDVVASNGRLVLASLVTLSEAHIERLRNLVRLKLIPDQIIVFADEKTAFMGDKGLAVKPPAS